jgi:hypothetical protein
MVKGVVLTGVLMLAACVPAEERGPRFLGPPVRAPGSDICGAAELQDMIGQPRSVLETIRFAVPLRVIEPGVAVTDDFIANRLNVTVGEDGTITSLSCG